MDSWLERLPWWLFAALVTAAGVTPGLAVYAAANGFRIGGL